MIGIKKEKGSRLNFSSNLEINLLKFYFIKLLISLITYSAYVVKTRLCLILILNI